MPSWWQPQAPADVQQGTPQQRMLTGQTFPPQVMGPTIGGRMGPPDGEPDAAPDMLAVLVVHKPLEHVPPASEQLVQVEPPDPHALSACAIWQTPLESQQPPAQLVESHLAAPLVATPLPPPLLSRPALAPALVLPLEVALPVLLPMSLPALAAPELPLALPLPTSMPVAPPASNENPFVKAPPPSKSP
jgi:hypothetical protein